jgi:hypothetical protein
MLYRGGDLLKVHELISQLQRVSNQDADVYVDHIFGLTKSDKVLINMSKATMVLVPAVGAVDKITISTEPFEEEL